MITSGTTPRRHTKQCMWTILSLSTYADHGDTGPLPVHSVTTAQPSSVHLKLRFIKCFSPIRAVQQTNCSHVLANANIREATAYLTMGT